MFFSSIFFFHEKLIQYRSQLIKLLNQNFDFYFFMYIGKETEAKNIVSTEKKDEEENQGFELPFFDLALIFSATNGFSEENKLGEGGFGPVYKVLMEGLLVTNSFINQQIILTIKCRVHSLMEEILQSKDSQGVQHKG